MSFHVTRWICLATISDTHTGTKGTIDLHLDVFAKSFNTVNMLFSVWNGKACSCKSFTGNYHQRPGHTQVAFRPLCLSLYMCMFRLWAFSSNSQRSLFFNKQIENGHGSTSLYSSCWKASLFQWILGILQLAQIFESRCWNTTCSIYDNVMVSRRGVAYKLRFRPSSVSDWIISIQWLSLCFWQLVSSQ